MLTPAKTISEWILYYSLHLRISLGCFIYPKYKSFRTFRVGPRTIIKSGCSVSLDEAETMKFIAANTSIPVPKVIHTHVARNIRFISMEFVPGQTLDEVWRILSGDEKCRIVSELRTYFQRLRNLTPPNIAVASVSGGPCHDLRRAGSVPLGPFQDLDDFHRFLRLGLNLEQIQGQAYADAIVATHTTQYRTVFSHGDLATRNIMINKNDKSVAAIIDWDCAGWYPEYWEYTKAHLNIGEADDWYACLGEIVGCSYDRELECEKTLLDRFELD